MAARLDISKLTLIETNTPNFCGIYICLCILTRKYYLGSAVNFRDRKSSHLCRLTKNNHHSKHFQNTWNLYLSGEFFIWYKIRDCKKENIKQIEQFYLDKYHPWDSSIGLNINHKATGGGGKMSDATKEKLRKANLGKIVSLESRRKMSESRLGVKRSEEACKNIRIANKKNAAKRIYITTEETREKLRKSSTGRKFPNRNFSGENNPNYGNKMSEESKRKIGEHNKNRKITPEEIKNRQNAMRKLAIETRNYYFIQISTNKIFHFHLINDLINKFGGRRSAYGDIWHRRGGRKTHNDFRRATELEIQNFNL